MLYYHAYAVIFATENSCWSLPKTIQAGVAIMQITWINISLARPVIFSGMKQLSFKAVFVIKVDSAAWSFHIYVIKPLTLVFTCI